MEAKAQAHALNARVSWDKHRLEAHFEMKFKSNIGRIPICWAVVSEETLIEERKLP